MTGEYAAFQAFQDGPSSGTLVELLRAHQDRIFRLCYQVLRNVHDAEEAAQETLLKIPGEIRRFAEHDAFRRWLNRVSLNAALETARKAARRRAHETRAAMEKPVPEPLDGATRLALFDAIAALDDGPRNLILDHYFEGESLEAIGRREGYSAPAACKKLDEARETLRRGLGGGAAALAVLPNLDILFDAVPAAPELVTGAVLARAHSSAAVLAAGGTLVASKTPILVAVAVTALVCLTAGTGIGVALKSRSERVQRERVDHLERQLAVAVSSMKTTPPDAPSEPPVETAKPEPKPADSPLASRLKRWKAWKDASRREAEELKGKLDPAKLNAYMLKKSREQVAELEGVFQLAFDDPETFLAFVKAPENEPYLDGFMLNALGLARLEPGFIMITGKDFSVYPEALTSGLFELAKSGSKAQRTAALSFFSRLTGAPPEYGEYFRTLLNDPEPEIQIVAINVLTGTKQVSGEELKVLIDLGSRSPHEGVRSRVADALRYVDKPEAAAYLFERLESPRDTREFVSALMGLSNKLAGANRIVVEHPISEDRYLSAISASWNRATDENTFKLMVYSALCAPVDKARPVLDQALGAAPSKSTKEMVAGILKRLDEGEKNAESLRSGIYGAK